MARLERAAPRSQDAGAHVARSVLIELGATRRAVERYCTLSGDGFRVAVSPAAIDYLERLSSTEQDRQIIRALPYALVNDRPRLWATDFALLAGARTEAEVREWYATRGVTNRGTTFGGLLVPDGDDGEPWTETTLRPAPASDGATGRSQRITANDLRTGQIRLKQPARQFFPPERTELEVLLSGERLMARYDPRQGPDQDRSPTLRFGREALASRVTQDEVLVVTRLVDGTPSLDRPGAS
mgnify:CR=1 FL=1